MNHMTDRQTIEARGWLLGRVCTVLWDVHDAHAVIKARIDGRRLYPDLTPGPRGWNKDDKKYSKAIERTL